MKLYCVNKNLGTSWFNIWCGTKAEAIEKAKEGKDDVVILVCTRGDKASGIELLNHSTVHYSNFRELEGVLVVERVWPTKLRR